MERQERHPIHTLLQLNSLVKTTIEDNLCDDYWLEAEIAELRENNGHCYLELVQKDERRNTPVARASAKCWRQTWMAAKPYFERVTGQLLKAGMKVLVCVYPQFHEAYGFSWIISDIDPTFTLGDLAQRRQQIIAQLRAEGVLELNKELPLPLFTQRIAVISSPTAAGYGDFRHQLLDNPLGLAFSITLFPAVMQGEGIERSLIAALNAVYDAMDSYDCVVIIRGGGATSDLSGFDTLALAENVANFPLPVITGIGHDRDECLLDIVSHTRVKTPTAAAAFLVERLEAVSIRIQEAGRRITNTMTLKMESERQRLARLSDKIPMLFSNVRTREDTRIDRLAERLKFYSAQTVIRQRHRIDLLKQKAEALDPSLLLRRGYSITLHDNRVVRDASRLRPGDVIVTRLEQGSVTSTVTLSEEASPDRSSRLQ